MVRRARWTIAIMLLLGFCVVARAQEGYYSVYLTQAKQGKEMEFETLLKKLVTANRDNSGDTWIATQTAFGESNTFTLRSFRSSYADHDRAHNALISATEKAMGHPGMEKFYEDYENSITGSRNILLRRRPDLSANFPSDPAAVNQIVGNTRWFRFIRIQVRPGQNLRFEQLAKQIKAAQEKADPHYYSWVSESIAGESGGVYYVTQVRSSFSDFDHEANFANQMSNDTLLNLLETASEVIQGEEVALAFIRPDLSNPPDDIASVAPSFWRPAPVAPQPTPGKAPAKK